MKFGSNFFNFFDLADIFRFRINLLLNKSQKSSTITGKLITIGILIFLIYSFFSSDVLKKSNPQTLSQDLMLVHHPQLLFTKENFTFVVGVADGNNVFYIDETMFSIYFSIAHLNNLNQEVNETDYNLEPCISEDFLESPSEFFILGLNGSYCLPNQALKLEGYWDEETIDYFWIEVRTCENSSDSNITCKSIDSIFDFMKDKYIDVYITDHNIDSSNYLRPLSRNLKIQFQELDLNLMKSMNLFLKNTIIETDDGFFFESLHYIYTFMLDNIQTDVMTKYQSNNMIYQINIYSSDLQKNVFRNYQKIQTLLAQLGGICNFLFFLGFLFSKIENQYKMISTISNELFIFPKLDAKTSPKNEAKQNLDNLLIKSHRHRKKNTLMIRDLKYRSQLTLMEINKLSNRNETLYNNQTETNRLFTSQNYEEKKLIKPIKIISAPFINDSLEGNKLPQKIFTERLPLSFSEIQERLKSTGDKPTIEIKKSVILQSMCTKSGVLS